jgi:hypothetical protein
MPYRIAGIDVHKKMLAVALADASMSRVTPRCLVPECGGGKMTATAKETLWAKYFTAAPRPLTPSERQYSDRRLRSKR